MGIHGENEGPWSKSVATQRALDQADNPDVLIVSDADVWLEPRNLLMSAAIAVHNRRLPWVVPHKQVRRLDQRGTAMFRIGRRTRLTQTTHPRRGVPGGGVFVIRTSDWLECGGFDPRFRGWGGEDSTFARAADVLIGPHKRMTGVLWHLYHEIQPGGDVPITEDPVHLDMIHRSKELYTSGDVQGMRAFVKERYG